MARLTLTPFGIAVPRLLTDTTLTPEQSTAIRHNAQILGSLLSPDLHTAGILVVPEVASMTSGAAREAWIRAVRAVAARHAVHGRQTYAAGSLLERHDVSRYLQQDQQRIIPLVFLVLLGVTYGIYRVKRFAVFALACVLLSLIWTLGIVGFTGIPLNVITSLLPAVILIVSVSVVIHLLNQFLDEVAAGAHGAVALERAVGRVGMACWLTSLTSAMGFFSLPVMQAPAIQEFGLFAGLGVLLAFVSTMTFGPIALLWIGQVTPARLSRVKEGPVEEFLSQLTTWVARHRRRVFVGLGLLCVVMLPGIFQIHEGTDMVRALKHDAPLRVSSEFIDRHLTGVHALEFLVPTPSGDTASTPATIRQVLAFSDWLRTQPGVTAILSPWEPLRGAPHELVADDERLQVLATLLPLGFPLERWLDLQRGTIRISARVTAIDSERFLDLADRAVQQAARLGLSVQVTGSYYLLSQMSRVLVQNQIASLLLAVVMILGTITLVLRSWKMGLVAAIPNLLPTVMIFGLMGWCGIELSTATTMIASVALGLFVDDTIHLLYSYTYEKRAGRETFVAIERSLRHAGRAVIFMTMILTLGFWTGLLGSFKPTLYFSFLMGLTMLFALCTELLVMPATVLALEGTSHKRDTV